MSRVRLWRMSRAHLVLVPKAFTPRSPPLQTETRAAQVGFFVASSSALWSPACLRPGGGSVSYDVCCLVFMIQRRSLWEAAPLCLSSWTQTSRWEHIWAPGSMQGWLLFSAGRDLITVSNDDVIRWRRTACRLWRFLHPTLQPLTGSSWRSRSKRGCIPWCLTPCTVCLCGLASHWCCWLRFVDANTRPCTGWGTGGTAVTHRSRLMNMLRLKQRPWKFWKEICKSSKVLESIYLLLYIII